MADDGVRDYGDEDGNFCCIDDCCGPGSWCCKRARAHDHPELKPVSVGGSDAIDTAGDSGHDTGR